MTSVCLDFHIKVKKKTKKIFVKSGGNDGLNGKYIENMNVLHMYLRYCQKVGQV